MPKICSHKGCKYNQFGGGYCKNHQYKRTDKKPKAPRKVAKKRAKQIKQYGEQRANIIAEAGGSIRCYAFEIGYPNPMGCSGEATEFNHGKGRENERILDFNDGTWLCNACHRYYTEHSKLGIELGIFKSKHTIDEEGKTS